MGDATPTLVVSDLHLGSGADVDLLRHPGPEQDALLVALDGVERLVVAGDLLELRHGPARVVLDRARPFLGALGARLGPDRELVLLAGNHDHRIVRPWLDRRRLAGRPLTLDATEDPAVVSPIADAIAEALAPARVRIAYPAVWLVDPGPGGGGVLATHGHYVDALWRMPTVERLVAGLAARAHGTDPRDFRTPDDFERVLGPAYGWMDGMAEYALGTGPTRSQRTSSHVWESLNSNRGWRGRVLRQAVPRAAALLTRAGLGEFDTQLTPDALRIAGTQGMARVVDALGIAPDHVIVGHTHRVGPLPGDAAWEWRLSHGGQLHNSGSWVRQGTDVSERPDHALPYRPGHGVRIGTDGVPRLVTLLDR